MTIKNIEKGEMTENDQRSSTDTAMKSDEQARDDNRLLNPSVEGALPPRTGYLRVTWYKRTGKHRNFPTSCATGCSLVAVSLFSLGMVLCGAKNTSTKVLAGLFFFSSGLVQIITGIWAIVDNNAWGSTFLLCYGAFFMSLGSIISDMFGVASSYKTTSDFDNAFGLYLIGWLVFTFFMWTATIRSTLPLFLLMTFLWVFFLLYAIAVFGNHSKVIPGIFCFLASACAFYGMYDGLHSRASSYLPSPEGKWTRMPGSKNAPTEESRIEFV